MRILFLVTEDWYFVSHRLSFAQALCTMGHEVAIACSVDSHGEAIEAAGIRLFPIAFARQSLSPMSLLVTSHSVRKIIRSFKPDLIHNVALRPILIGNFAAVGMRVPRLNAVAGMGSAFTSESGRMRLVAPFLHHLLRWCLRRRGGFNVFQNHEDLQAWSHKLDLLPERTLLIRGAGVDFSGHVPVAEPEDFEKVILFAGRLLASKGIKDVVEASKILRNRGVPHILRVAGEVDPANADSVSRHWMQRLNEAGAIEWLGHRNDILQQMDSANIVTLPSYYGEGLPKVLLEAGLARRAVVTTDMIGCREVVAHEENGLLVPPRHPEALADALQRLLMDDVLRNRLAQAHFRRIYSEFSSDKIFNQFFEFYTKIENWHESQKLNRLLI
jgi:glycosyltransferase involved in cell wall biosynthesis